MLYVIEADETRLEIIEQVRVQLSDAMIINTTWISDMRLKDSYDILLEIFSKYLKGVELMIKGLNNA